MNKGIEIPLVILAGGRATRLGSLADELPKFLMPIQDGLCFADLQLNWVAAQGFKKVILSLGYLGEKIRNYCGNGAQYGLEISYAFDGDNPLGTGGAVKKVLSQLGSYAALMYGDTILKLPCSEIVQRATEQHYYALMSVLKNEVPGHQANAQLLSDGRVEYSKSSPLADWKYIDYGFLVLSPDFVKEMPEALSAYDLAQSLESVSQGGRLWGYLATHRFWEIGSPAALKEFQKQCKREFSHLYRKP